MQFLSDRIYHLIGIAISISRLKDSFVIQASDGIITQKPCFEL